MAHEGQLRYHFPRFQTSLIGETNRNIVQDLHQQEHAAQCEGTYERFGWTQGRAEGIIDGEGQRGGDWNSDGVDA